LGSLTVKLVGSDPCSDMMVLESEEAVLSYRYCA